jgi:general stress protein YciG
MPKDSIREYLREIGRKGGKVKGKKGFAAMSPAKRREIAKKGGAAGAGKKRK